ncbi:hypothetical protein HK405_010759, partial [Cladochytrium tenue]
MPHPPPAKNKKGIFIFNKLPKVARSGESLRLWVDLRLGASVTADDNVTLEVIGIARASWIVRPDSQFATEADRLSGTSRKVQSEDEIWVKRANLTGAQSFDKGDHSYIQSIPLDAGLFPTTSYKDPVTEEEFSVFYVIRATLPSRDDPIEFEKPIEIVPGDLDVSVLAPLSVSDKSPRGVTYALRSRRGQWIHDVASTLFYSLKAPPNADVAVVLLELIQRVGLPGPANSEDRVGIERTVTTYNLPGCRPGQTSDLILKLSLPPNLPPSITL